MKAKREFNALHYLLGCLAVSIILGFLFGSTSLGVVWYVVTSLVVAAISFFVLFWLGVLFTVIFRMKIKGGEPAHTYSSKRRHAKRSRSRRYISKEEETAIIGGSVAGWQNIMNGGV